MIVAWNSLKDDSLFALEMMANDNDYVDFYLDSSTCYYVNSISHLLSYIHLHYHHNLPNCSIAVFP